MAGSQGLQEPTKSPVGRCRVSPPQGLVLGLGSLAAVALTEAWDMGPVIALWTCLPRVLLAQPSAASDSFGGVLSDVRTINMALSAKDPQYVGWGNGLPPKWAKICPDG